MSRCGDMAIRNYPRWRRPNLGFVEPKIAPLDTLSPKTLPRTKHGVYLITRCGHSWGIWNLHFGGRGGRRGSAMVPFERAMVVSSRLSIVTVALSVTIRPQFTIECLRRSNQQGVCQIGPKFRGVSLGVDPSCWGLRRANIPG